VIDRVLLGAEHVQSLPYLFLFCCNFANSRTANSRAFLAASSDVTTPGSGCVCFPSSVKGRVGLSHFCSEGRQGGVTNQQCIALANCCASNRRVPYLVEQRKIGHTVISLKQDQDLILKRMRP